MTTDPNITVRVTLNGAPFATVEMTREIAESYLPSGCSFHGCPGRPRLPEDWSPEPLSIAHLVMAQAQARTAGLSGLMMYRMHPLAACEVETAIMASSRNAVSEYLGDDRIPFGWTPMTFRGIPVVGTERVPWVDFDVRTE